MHIHSMVVEETGGMHGVRDMKGLMGAAEAPRQAVFGKELYPTVYLKAAAYARNIIMGHFFLDGNKRTGMTSTFVFLEDNGYLASLKEGEIEAFALDIVKKKLDIEAIAVWIKKHTKKIR